MTGQPNPGPPSGATLTRDTSRASAPTNPHRSRIGLVALIFVWPITAIAWAIVALVGPPQLAETGFLAGPTILAWALTMFLMRERIKRSGLLGQPTLH